MRILTLTGLFPNQENPLLGSFIQSRLRAVRERGHEVEVIAPLRWVPPGPLPERFRSLRRVPATEVIDGFQTYHPRFPAIPGRAVGHGRAYAKGVRKVFNQVVDRFKPDIIDSNYMWPDAVGAVALAKERNLPITCTARGSDVKLFGKVPELASQISKALGQASRVLAVSEDLGHDMQQMGLIDRPALAIRNGIDPSMFHAGDRSAARAALKLPTDRKILVTVAHLVPEHGHEVVINALKASNCPEEAYLVIVGDGILRPQLERQVASLGLADRVHFAGAVPHRAVPQYLQASDLCLLISDREGCPNIVLEASACHIPCLLSDLPEMEEVLSIGHHGSLVKRSPDSIAEGMAREFSLDRSEQPRAAVRTWADVAKDFEACFEEVVSKHRS